MKYLKQYTIIALVLTPWLFNFEQFNNCFENGNSQCEIIHGIGVLFPPLSYITVWFPDDKN